MTTTRCERLVLVSRPDGDVTPGHFRRESAVVPPLRPGEALVRVRWLGIEPTYRTWLNDDGPYAAPTAIGATVGGAGVGQVVRSRSERLPVGTWAYGRTGWQTHIVAADDVPLLDAMHPVPPGVEPRAMLGVFGSSGLTAWVGLHLAGVRPGETVLVSAAAGAVGSVVSQLAHVRGCRVIGVVGGERKRDWLLGRGIDAAVVRTAGPLDASLADLAGDGVDVVFDNVGGSFLEAALDHLAIGARIMLCGSVSSGYRKGAYGALPGNYMQLGFRRARMQGFIFFDHVDRFPDAFADLSSAVRDGLLEMPETIHRGLGSAPDALAGLFRGDNLGKTLVELPG